VETINSCVKTLIFGSSSFIALYVSFFLFTLFAFFVFQFFIALCPLFLFDFCFALPFLPFFLTSVFRLLRVSSLAYHHTPTCLGLKGLFVVVDVVFLCT
jgi:hypothetical protein